MSGVERAGYMDNIRSQSLAETIGKERKIQNKHFAKLDAEGRLPPPLTPPDEHNRPTGPLDTMTHPAYLTAIMDDPEQKMLTRMSESIYSATNPGYMVRDGINMASVAKKDYVWDQEEINYMREMGELHKTHHMRKTDQTAYVEARAKQANLMKGPGGNS